MAKTFRLAATQVAFGWSDKGHKVNPYSDQFDASAVPAHVEKNIRLQLELFEKAGRMGVDLVVGAEDMQRLGHFGAYLDDVSVFRKLVEPIPGPTSKRIAGVARKYRMYIVACYPEKIGRKCCNTGVLFDRAGRIRGKYRKVQLPADETWVYTPGNTFPVFRTEMGNVGIAICYDMMFPEIVRCLALKGADVICHPTMGYGWTENVGEATVKSRAADNGVTIVVACGKRSQVVNCWGEILSDAGRRKNVVVCADVETNSPMTQSSNHYGTVTTGLSDVRERWTKERRTDLFRLVAARRPPLMKRYSKKTLPRTKDEIREVYEKVREERRRLARGLAARYTWD
jgi:predicted amidohydrolase